MIDLNSFIPFLGLLFFGNIENLILASQGVVVGANPKKLALCSILAVSSWLIIGTFATTIAIKYANIIEFIGGFAIFVLGAQSMLKAAHILN